MLAIRTPNGNIHKERRWQTRGGHRTVGIYLSTLHNKNAMAFLRNVWNGNGRTYWLSGNNKTQSSEPMKSRIDSAVVKWRNSRKSTWDSTSKMNGASLSLSTVSRLNISVAFLIHWFFLRRQRRKSKNKTHCSNYFRRNYFIVGMFYVSFVFGFFFSSGLQNLTSNLANRNSTKFCDTE